MKEEDYLARDLKPIFKSIYGPDGTGEYTIRQIDIMSKGGMCVKIQQDYDLLFSIKEKDIIYKDIGNINFGKQEEKIKSEKKIINNINFGKQEELSIFDEKKRKKKRKFNEIDSDDN